MEGLSIGSGGGDDFGGGEAESSGPVAEGVDEVFGLGAEVIEIGLCHFQFREERAFEPLGG